MAYRIVKEQRFSPLLDLILDTPHTLIAGTTGSGKSVLLNGIIYNFMLNYGTNNKLVLIDPKRVELSIYKDLPHTRFYTHDSVEAVDILDWCITQIECRYNILENQHKRQWQGDHVYIIIDEIADLMLSDERKELEKRLQKITQIARAVNIHLICATQLVRSDILTTKITGNIPTKIALRCASALESRQVVGVSGAELLPHHGQGLLLTPKNTSIQTINIPYIPEEYSFKLVKQCQTIA